MREADAPDDGEIGDAASERGHDLGGGAFDAWLAKRLADAAAAAPAEAVAPAPDAGRVAAHLAGYGDEELVRDAAGRPSVRRLLGDVVSVAAEAEADVERGAPPLSASARRAALDAFDVNAAEGATEPDEDALAPVLSASFARPLPRISRAWLRAAAAIVLVGLPATLFLSSRATAAPALALVGIEREDGLGTVTIEGPRSIALGGRIAASGDEHVALRLGEGARVLLAPGSEVHVVRDDAPRAGSRAPRAALALDRGAALLAALEAPAKDDARVPRVLLPDGRWLALEAGAAHVAIAAGGGTVVSLPADAAVRCCRADGAGDPTRGPGAFVLRADGLVAAPEGSPEGRAARAALDDLAFYGGAPLASRTPTGRATSARYWRVLRVARGDAPVAPARSSESDGIPAIRFDLGRASVAAGGGAPAAPVARIAWRPDAEALGADHVTVVATVRPAPEVTSGRTSPDTPPPRVVVVAEAFDGTVFAEASGLAEASATAQRAATLRVEVVLPTGWREKVKDGELVLAFRAGDAPVAVWFESAVFRSGPPVRAADAEE